MLSVLSAAYAHPSDLPHLHATDPAAVVVLAAWIVAGLVYAAVAHRGVKDPAV